MIQMKHREFILILHDLRDSSKQSQGMKFPNEKQSRNNALTTFSEQYSPCITLVNPLSDATK